MKNEEIMFAQPSVLSITKFTDDKADAIINFNKEDSYTFTAW